tara:strand:- start:10141 stop:10269 length:129 start_codon:yes stop_codon:yes gene_type:complete
MAVAIDEVDDDDASIGIPIEENDGGGEGGERRRRRSSRRSRR